MIFLAEEILDEFHKGTCILVKDAKFYSLQVGDEIFVKGKKASLHKKELGKRSGRMVLTISYME